MAHITEKYFDETVQTIAKSLRFDTTQKPAEDGCPFGKETAACLDWFLKTAESFGFQTKNYDNYIGEVIFGEGEEFAILAHLDVVPATGEWKFPPFSGAINDAVSAGGVEGMKIWGRGAMDDKGPAICCLYALKALKDEGFQPTRTIKLIVGCNEENGWECIHHYNKVSSLPKEGFTPDANFPVIYAEKGILHVALHFPIENSPFKTLDAGSAVNMVPDKATALITKDAGAKLAFYDGFTELFYDNTTSIVNAYGKSAHGSTPHLGVNAFEKLLAFFKELNDDCKTAYEILFNDSLGLTNIEDETGKLTFAPDVASFSGGVLTVKADIRIPSTHTKEEVLALFEKAGVSFTELRYQAPLYNDKNGKLVKTLSGVFTAVTGKTAEPIAIGGGTYARALQKGCGFGPEMDGDENVLHQPNEYITFAQIRLFNEIYYEAIKTLTRKTTSYTVAKM